MLDVVDFPHPDSPTKPKLVPLIKLKEISSTARKTFSDLGAFLHGQQGMEDCFLGNSLVKLITSKIFFEPITSLVTGLAGEQ